MSEVIRQETAVFLLSVCHGIALTLFYDILRSLRRAFAHNLFAVSAEDFLYWLSAGFGTFCLAFLKTDGVIRGYAAVGIGLGAVLYHYSVSSAVVKLFSEILKFLKKAGGFLLGSVAAPAWKTLRTGKKVIEFAGKTGYNLFVKVKKRHADDLQDEDYCEYKGKRGRQYGKKKKASKQK